MSQTVPAEQKLIHQEALSVSSEMRESLFSRLLCSLSALSWLVLFAFLWLGAFKGFGLPAAPRSVALLGLAWFALGFTWRAGYFVSLALALPWFGNNPGGPHHLYLLEMGMMGLVARHLIERALGRVGPRRSRLDPWITFFVIYSCLTVFDHWLWLRTEFQVQRALALMEAPPPPGALHDLKLWIKTVSRFFYRIYLHDGTADVFGLQVALKLALSAGMYAAVRDRPWSARLLRWFWWTALAALIFSCAIGWLNYIGWLSLSWWRGENPDITRFGYSRLQSLYWHAGWFAEYLAVLAPAVLALGWMARRSSARWLFWGLAAALFVTQLFTMARAGWLALSAGYLAVAALAFVSESDRSHAKRVSRELALIAGILIISLIVIFFVSPTLRHRVGELFAFEHRTGIWRSALELCRFKPWTGLSLGNYYFSHSYLFKEGHPFFALDKVTAHNLYLHLCAERGIIGLALFLVIIFLLFKTLIGSTKMGNGNSAIRNPSARRSFSEGGPQSAIPRVLRLSAFGGLTALAVDGFFQYSFYIRVIEILFWLMAGWGVWFMAEDHSTEKRSPRSRKIVWCAAMLLCVALFGWEHRQAFKPWTIVVDGKHLWPAGREVMLDWPAGARRVSLDLGCMDPGAEIVPVVYVVPLAERGQKKELTNKQIIKQVEFKKWERQTVLLDWPAGRVSGDRPVLLIEASRTWMPWVFSIRQWPIAHLGVLYWPPEVVR